MSALTDNTYLQRLKERTESRMTLAPSSALPTPMVAPPRQGRSEFGDALRVFRARRGISQSKLAERAEFDHSYVSRLESGGRMPAREAVERLGEALQLDAADLDALLAAAGFLPGDVTSLLSSEPEVGQVLTLLRDETAPSDYRESVRDILRSIMRLHRARFANGAAA